MSKYRALVAALLSLALLVVGFVPAQAAVKRTTAKCADLIVIGVRGSGEAWNAGAEPGFGKPAAAVARQAVSRIKRSGTVRYVGVKYPAMKVDLKWTRSKYFGSVRDGAKETMKVVDGLARSCSKSKFMMVGYSQGASVLRWAFRDMPAKNRNRVVAVGLIGDPERRGFNVSPSERGLLENFGSGNLRGSGILGSGPALPTRASTTLVTVCHQKDNVCNRPLTSNIGPIEGLKQKTHTSYYHSSAGSKAAGGTLYIMLAKNGFK